LGALVWSKIFNAKWCEFETIVRTTQQSLEASHLLLFFLLLF
jgi:hypothetical protein